MLQEACLDTCDGNDRVQAKVFRVLASWFSVAVIPQEHIVNTKLMQAPIQALVRGTTDAHRDELEACLLA